MSDFLLGGTYPTSIKLGTTSVSKLMMGTVQVWPRLVAVKYGYLYNWFAVANTRNIASAGWRVPTQTDWSDLVTYLGGATVAGGKLKETGLTFWDTPNTGATNEVGFNGRGVGVRRTDLYSVVFDLVKQSTWYWSSTPVNSGTSYGFTLQYNTQASVLTGAYNRVGYSVRLIKNTTSLTNGQTGIYVGNNGLSYPTICIGTQEFVSANIRETQYADATIIPLITDATNWNNDLIGAVCAYNNDESNV